jgi:chromosome partitioning protein
LSDPILRVCGPRILRARQTTDFMPVIAVINRKGGSGKSTLATHLAAYCATAGKRVMLGDVDRQQSAQTWLRLRGAQDLPLDATVQGWAIDPKNVLRAPAGVTHVVLDTPGGMRGFELARIVMSADVILMPVCNSVFDRESAAECFAELKTLPRVASGRCKIAAIGMRLDGRTKAAEVLAAWAQKLDLPFIGVLRETQAYVRCIELGLTLFDLPKAQVQGDLAQWQSILKWLEPVLNSQPAATTAPKPAQPAPQAVEAQAVPLKPSRPIIGSAHQAARSAPGAPPVRPKSVLSRVQPARPAIGSRIGQLLDTLPIPRFLQRNP